MLSRCEVDLNRLQKVDLKALVCERSKVQVFALLTVRSLVGLSRLMLQLGAYHPAAFISHTGPVTKKLIARRP